MIFLISMLLVGFSGIVAQIIILRELLVGFSGNELTIAIILANWVIAEAIGAFLAGKFADRIRNKIRLFVIFEIIFLIVLPIAIYLCRVFKALVGIPAFEAVSFPVVIISSLVIILPVGFIHGALFSLGCKIRFLKNIDGPAGSVARIYSWEMWGTIVGGLALAFLFINHFTAFEIILFIFYINLVIILVLICNKRFKFISIVLTTILLALFFIPISSFLEITSLSNQWKGEVVLDHKNSNYGNVVVTKNLEQYTFFYNGIPIITTPYPDRDFVEEFGNFALLFHSNPKKVLLVSSGAGGLINEVLKHDITSLKYVEIDSLIIEMLKKYPTDLSARELNDRRLEIINTDPRYFLKTTQDTFDIILIGLSNQSDLSTNRIFTVEFFGEAKKRLNPEGIISLWVPGSLTYLGVELRDLNKTILNSLKNQFLYVRIIPGDYNIYLASNSLKIMNIKTSDLSKNILKENIQTSLLIPSYIAYRLDSQKIDWFNKELSGGTLELNRDLKPIAVFENQKLITKKLSPGLNVLFEIAKAINLKIVIIAVILITIILNIIIKRVGSGRIAIAYAIATTGFFGMLANLLLIFSYQIFYGYLYYKITLLLTVFMSGIALASIYISPKLEGFKNPKRLLLWLEGGLILFSISLGLIISNFNCNNLVFYFLLLISGCFMGLEFPIASKLYLRRKEEVGSVSGQLYAADMLGGWVAGMLAAVVFLPILGFLDTCIMMALLKLSSFILLTKRSN